MITFNTLGGHGQLGNQMFQYASLLGVKYKNNYDIVFSQNVKNNSYLFNFFNLTEYTINDIPITNEYRESTFHFNSNIFSISDNISLFGLFQSEKYFEHCSDVVKKEFTFKEEIIKKAKNILQPHLEKKLVSLHIRRGDYLLNKDTYPIYGKEYIDRAIKILKNKVSNLKFFIFTNDIIWTEKNFNVEEKNFFIVSKYTKEPWEDLELMSLCKHNIISNSTFSWWAAYKNNYRKKTIIAPKKWINDNNQHFNDLFMKDWISI